MFETPDNFHSKLPARITGIVFWGLVFVGLLTAALLLNKSEEELRSLNVKNVHLIAYKLERVLTDSSGRLLDDEASLKSTIQQFTAKMDVSAIEIKSRSKLIEIDKPAADDDTYSDDLYYFNVVNNAIETVSIRVYFPNQAKQVSTIRKNMLLSIGGFVFLFGMLLQYILQRVITRPFLNMVMTAKRFSEGSKAVRFDESREDEFGYLGRFINNSIEQLLKHQMELEHALDRAAISESALSVEKELAEVTLHSITDSVVTVDIDETIDYLNPVAERLIGISLNDARGRKFNEVVTFVNDNVKYAISNPLKDCFDSAEIITLPEHSSLISGEASIVAIEASIAPMKNNLGELMGAVIVIQDVSKTRRLTHQLSYQASHDMLTGLYNRRKFEEHLEEILANVTEEDRTHCLCYLDLDQFKIVNDTCGHVAGDELLQQLPSLFDKVLRSGDIVARLGGDEFGVLLENCSVSKAELIADKLRQQVKDFRFVWEDKIFEIGVSIGVVAITPDNAVMSQIMASADLACYAAKDSGRNRVHVYESSDEAVSIRHGEMHWTARIRSAMNEGRLRLYQQQIVGIGKNDSEHMEVLLRMLDEDGNVVPPGAFLPAAERYNLMVSIDRWVISEVFRMFANEQHVNPRRTRDMMISINLSGDTLNDDKTLDYILAERERYDISLVNICFEITETVAISNLAKATAFMHLLKNYGCRFALDDFGSGLSSFAYLKTLPVDYLKIDGAFVKDVSRDPIDRAMVQSIQQIASVMQLETIAEGVENATILRILKEIGVEFVQGYFIGRPSILELGEVSHSDI